MWTRKSRARVARIERQLRRYPSDRQRVESHQGVAAADGATRSSPESGFARGAERHPLPGSNRLRLANVAAGLPALADRVLVVPNPDAALPVQHDPRHRLDAGPERQGREASPSGGVIDSQSIKAPAAKKRGYDAGKKIVGRKRHIAVDTDGRLLMVNLTTADISDSAGAQAILDAIRKRWPWVKHLFADSAYDRGTLMDKAAAKNFVIEVIRRCDGQKGFKVLPRRWVVERTFGWMTRWRRLVRDYEARIDVSDAMIHVAMGSLLLRRISH